MYNWYLLVKVAPTEELILFEEAFFVELNSAVDALETMLMVGLVRSDLEHKSIQNRPAAGRTMNN